MAKLIVKGDPVDGTDTHKVKGLDTTQPTPKAYSGTGVYTYAGEVSGDLSDFVKIDDIAVAVVVSTSRLRADGIASHLELAGSNYDPTAPPPNPVTLKFDPAVGVGDGKPASDAGSALVTIGGKKALLAGDSFDTCGIDGGKRAASVAAQKQGWVTSA